MTTTKYSSLMVSISSWGWYGGKARPNDCYTPCGGVCTKGAVIMRHYARQYRSYSTYRRSLKATSVRQDAIGSCGLFSLKIYRNPNEWYTFNYRLNNTCLATFIHVPPRSLNYIDGSLIHVIVAIWGCCLIHIIPIYNMKYLFRIPIYKLIKLSIMIVTIKNAFVQRNLWNEIFSKIIFSSQCIYN